MFLELVKTFILLCFLIFEIFTSATIANLLTLRGKSELKILSVKVCVIFIVVVRT